MAKNIKAKITQAVKIVKIPQILKYKPSINRLVIITDNIRFFTNSWLQYRVAIPTDTVKGRYNPAIPTSFTILGSILKTKYTGIDHNNNELIAFKTNFISLV